MIMVIILRYSLNLIVNNGIIFVPSMLLIMVVCIKHVLIMEWQVHLIHYVDNGYRYVNQMHLIMVVKLKHVLIMVPKLLYHFGHIVQIGLIDNVQI